MTLQNRFRSPGLIALLAVAVASAPSTIPTHAASTNSLSDVVRETLANHPELMYYRAELKAAHASRRTAGRLDLPEAAGTVGQNQARNSPNSPQSEGSAWSVSLTQSFEWPGRLGLRKAIANHDVQLAELGLARFQASLAARILARAHSLSGAEQKQQIAEEVATRFRSLREVLIQRDPAGIAPQLELRILDATELTLRRRASEAKAAAEDCRLELNQLMGHPATAPIPFDPPSIPRWKTPLPIDQLLAAAQTNNFELRMRIAELEQQGFRVQLARNERWPAIKVGPQYSEENAGGENRILGIGLSFPLPLWRQNSSNIEAAQARQAQAESLLNTLRRDLERRIIAVARRYEARLEEMSRWTPDVIQHFAEAASLADRHYRLAAVPASTYTELQKQYVEAMETVLDSRIEALSAAAELEELTGLPLLPTP